MNHWNAQGLDKVAGKVPVYGSGHGFDDYMLVNVSLPVTGAAMRLEVATLKSQHKENKGTRSQEILYLRRVQRHLCGRVSLLEIWEMGRGWKN